MSYIDEIFERLDIQHVREYLLHGSECVKVDTRPYKERVESTWKELSTIFHQRFPNKEDYEDMTGYVLDYGTACQNVYMEIGMQCGFVLATQIFTNTKTKPESKE